MKNNSNIVKDGNTITLYRTGTFPADANNLKEVIESDATKIYVKLTNRKGDMCPILCYLPPLLEAIMEEGEVNVSWVMKKFHISKHQARYRLNKFLKKDLLERVRRGVYKFSKLSQSVYDKINAQ
jgi:predicted HTH transcriptional regulator